MNLMAALEDEFEIKFYDDEIINSMSYGLIVDILEKSKL